MKIHTTVTGKSEPHSSWCGRAVELLKQLRGRGTLGSAVWDSKSVDAAIDALLADEGATENAVGNAGLLAAVREYLPRAEELERKWGSPYGLTQLKAALAEYPAKPGQECHDGAVCCWPWECARVGQCQRADAPKRL